MYSWDKMLIERTTYFFSALLLLFGTLHPKGHPKRDGSGQMSSR